MEEDYIDQLYNHLGGEKSGINKDSFRRDISTNKDYNRQIYDYMGGEKAGIDYNAFYKDTFAEKKKTKPTQPTSESTSAAISSGGQNSWTPNDGFKSDTATQVATQTPQQAKATPKPRSTERVAIDDVIDKAKVTTAAIQSVPTSVSMMSMLPKPIQSGILSLGSGLSGLASGIAEMYSKSPRFMGMKDVSDKAFEISKDMAEISQDIMVTSKAEAGISDPTKSTFEHLTEGNLSDFGKSLIRDVGAQVPQMSLTIGTGGSAAGLAALGATAAGGAMTEEREADGSLSALDFSQSLVKGATEVVLEKIFNADILAGGAIVKNLDNVLSSGGKALKQQIQAQGKQKVKSEIVRSFSDIAKAGAKGGGQEILEEDLSAVISFIVDAIDEDNFNAEGLDDLVNDLGNSTLIAGFTGTPISVLAAKASQVKYTKEEQRNIDTLTDIINNPDVSKEGKKIATERLSRIKKGVDEKTLENYSKIAALPTTGKVEVLSKQETISKLEQDKVKSSDVDVRDAIDERIKEIESEIDGIVNAETQTSGEPIIDESGAEVVPQGELSPEDAWKMSNIMMDKHDAALENFGDKKSFWDKWGKRLFERQINVIKALGDSPEAKFAEATMTTVAGARSRADEMFKDAEKSIYKGVNPETERVLDQVLFHKRVIQLDSKYDASGKERLKHTEGFNKESSEAALEGLRRQYGNEVFNYINTRADEYFRKQSEILKSLKDNGLIDEATYNRFKDDDYIQRVFLDHINSEASSKSPVDSGLTKEQLKKLDGGSEGLLLMDSRLLLNAAYRSAQQRIFQNKANEALYKVLEKGSVIGNPLKKTTPNKKTGGWDYGESQSGYTKRRYFKDGKEVAFEIRDDFDKEWHDMEKSTSDLDNWLRTLMGTAILKRMATGINATFAIGNIANDFGNVIMFTDTFDDSNIFLGAAKLAKEFTFNFGQLAALNSVGKSTPEFAKIVDDFGKYGGNMEFLTTYGKPESIVKRRRSERGVRGAFGKAIDTGANALAFTGEVSEKAMRLAVFEKVRQDAYKDAGGIENITQEEIDNIGYTAAAKARKTMDFAKGGLWTKKLDAVSPYLNAAAQGTKVAASYVYKNPKKFTSKLAQISSAVGALTLYNMMVGDDEDWDNIPDYEKNNYFIIFMPNKQEDGSRGYIRIKKTPAMVPFLNFFEAATIAAYNQSTGRSFGAKDNFAEREWDAINDALPLPIDPRQLPNKLPPVPKGVISYLANYDFFRNQEIVRGKEKDIDEKFQGLYDENVPLIYKEIGQKTGLSPRKLKAATEMVITTPSTNTIVGGAYSLLDKLVAKTMDSPEEWLAKDKEVTSLLGGAKARVYRRTNPNFANFNSDFQQQFEKEIRTEDYITREAIKNAVDEIVPLGADPSKQNFNEYRKQVLKKAKDIVIDKEISNEEKKTYLKFADNYAKDGLLKREIPEYYKLSSIKYLRASPETKAKLFAYEFGLVDPRGEDMKDLMRKMKRMGVPTSDRFLKEYIRLYSAKTQEQQNP